MVVVRVMVGVGFKVVFRVGLKVKGLEVRVRLRVRDWV